MTDALIFKQFRRKLPARRASRSLNFSAGNHSYVANVGYYKTGEIGEVFLYAGKAGSDVSLIMLEASIALSMAFQFGARASDMRGAMPHDGRGEKPGDP